MTDQLSVNHTRPTTVEPSAGSSTTADPLESPELTESPELANWSEAPEAPESTVWPANFDWDGFGFETRQVHAGEYDEPSHGARITPIYLSNAFRQESFDGTADRFSGAVDGHSYSRHRNPTNEVAERRIASLEGGAGAIVVGSGQAAITMTMLGLLEAGDHLVSASSIYNGTRVLFSRAFARLGISVTFVDDAEDEAAWEAAVRDETKAIFAETIPNPRNNVIDLALVSRVAKRHGIPVVVDNTVATPYLIRPLEHGADIVIHSSTKFLSGHGAVMSGVIVDGGIFDWTATSRKYPLLTDSQAPGKPSFLDTFGIEHAFEHYLRLTAVNDFGPALSPFNGFLLQQGIETLSLRMERHVDNARAIALWLAEQPEVISVDYSGLPGHPLADVAERLYGGRTGSVFAFTVHGGQAGAKAFIDRVQVFSRMTNIGDVRSMVLHPATTTHLTLTPEHRARLGIVDGLIRLSVGIESIDDLLFDVRAGLAAVAAAGLVPATVEAADADVAPAEPELADITS
ncbi:O-acetylhomoserine aminocarboxypropyltransferase/cysteine synthase family protein [Plantibacter sp. Mn2098]|uniref:O-acetylhomoserine aminocarboxypropyltransferase/cysteine synthase family protein n=1 Tax=Plantibacter sp. Mn2098 TaxID=3395266 RepID=UPI003BE24FFD